MDWLENHLGSLGYAGDFYIPTSGNGGGGIGDLKKPVAGEEQIKKIVDYGKPRVVQTNKYDYPRIQKFFEWEQFLNYVDWTGCEGRRASQNTDDAYFDRTLTQSFQEAMQLARYGWPEGLRRLKDIEPIDLQLTKITQQSYDIESRYDVAGGSVNIGRYLSYAPDCMRRMAPTRNHTLPSRIQKVMILGDYDGNVHPNDVLRHGYMVYQIIDALEQANIQTDITIAFSSNKNRMYELHDYHFYETYIRIKEPADIIYPEKLLFCLAHPSMFRRLVFSEREKNPWSVRDFFHFYQTYPGEHGYGCHIPEWLPPQHMLLDTLLIPNISNTTDTTQLISTVQNMIMSQYENAR